MDISSLVTKIKEKKELNGLAKEIVEKELRKYLKTINSSKLTIHNKKIVITEVRSNLRRLSGQYQKKIKNKKNLSFEEILRTHHSTSERINFYPQLKAIIHKINPKSILDLGCGLNPIALAIPKIKYHASDIKLDELKIVHKFFKKNKISGSTFVYDLREISTNLPKTDLCIIFKVIDILTPSSKKRNIIAEKIISNIPSKKIIISFATRKISGKLMNCPQRKWFEAILKTKNLSFEKFHSSNEIFYLISNKQPSSSRN